MLRQTQIYLWLAGPGVRITGSAVESDCWDCCQHEWHTQNTVRCAGAVCEAGALQPVWVAAGARRVHTGGGEAAGDGRGRLAQQPRRAAGPDRAAVRAADGPLAGALPCLLLVSASSLQLASDVTSMAARQRSVRALHARKESSAGLVRCVGNRAFWVYEDLHAVAADDAGASFWVWCMRGSMVDL